MKILHCNLCVNRGRVECKPEYLMQTKMTSKLYCENNNILQSHIASMIPAIRFCQRYLEDPLDKLLQIIKDNPRRKIGTYFEYTKQLNRALEKENSSDGNL